MSKQEALQHGENTDKFNTAALEAILFAGGENVPVSRICETLCISEHELEAEILKLQEKLVSIDSALEVIRLDDSYQLCAKKEYAGVIRRAFEIKRNTPLSSAALEVLAVIAYNQPVTRSYIEQVRGVDCSGVVSSLCAKGLIEESGRLDLPGRPLLYVTTPVFLRTFGLSSLDELPELPRENDENDDNREEENIEPTVIQVNDNTEEPDKSPAVSGTENDNTTEPMSDGVTVSYNDNDSGASEVES